MEQAWISELPTPETRILHPREPTAAEFLIADRMTAFLPSLAAVPAKLLSG